MIRDIIKKMYVVVAISFACAQAETSRTRQTTATATPSQSYSASMVYPTQVYCPTGYSCAFAAPTFFINAS